MRNPAKPGGVGGRTKVVGSRKRLTVIAAVDPAMTVTQ